MIIEYKEILQQLEEADERASQFEQRISDKLQHIRRVLRRWLQTEALVEVKASWE